MVQVKRGRFSRSWPWSSNDCYLQTLFCKLTSMSNDVKRGPFTCMYLMTHWSAFIRIISNRSQICRTFFFYYSWHSRYLPSFEEVTLNLLRASIFLLDRVSGISFDRYARGRQVSKLDTEIATMTGTNGGINVTTCPRAYSYRRELRPLAWHFMSLMNDLF